MWEGAGQRPSPISYAYGWAPGSPPAKSGPVIYSLKRLCIIFNNGFEYMHDVLVMLLARVVVPTTLDPGRSSTASTCQGRPNELIESGR